MTAAVDIRPMTADDIPRVIELENTLFSDPWPEAVFHEELTSNYSYPFVAQIDDHVVGYAMLWIGVDEGHLSNIAVAPEYQRKSVAKKLLSFILRLALNEGLGQILLEVRPTNAPAIALYEKFGFEKLAIRKKYYNDPVEDCLVMRKVMSAKRRVE